MKYLFAFFVFAASFNLSVAQEAHVLFNRLNMGVYNPAFTGVNGSFVSLSNRSQWASVADAPQTNYLIYQLPQKKNVLLGFTAQNDRVFIENKTHITIDYNYRLKLNERHFLYLGLKGGGFYNNIDTDRLQRIYTSYNPALAPIKSYFTPVLGVGIHYRAPNFFLGVGVPSVFDNKRYQDNGGWQTTATDVAYLYLSGGYTYPINETFSFDPVFVYRALPDNPNLFSGTIAINYKNQLAIGTGYANNNNFAFFITSKDIKGIEWGYGYEFMNRNDLTSIQGGTHEFILRFLLGTKEKEETIRKDGFGKRN